METIADYQAALNFIHGRPRFKKRPTLERMAAFLAALGHPEQGLPIIHVAGTNGKGSVVAMTRAMLAQSGLTVATFTSPFITRFNERIAIDGQPISDADLVKYTRQLVPVVEALDAARPEGGPVEFEIDLAIALLYFQDRQPDAVILEVGIGGKWDSTNVVTAPVATAIVTVGYDHMAILGDTLAEIAAQKAGIIKPGRPVISGRLPAAAQEVVDQQAAKLGSPQLKFGRDFTVSNQTPGALYPKLAYRGPGLGHFGARLGLAGAYQVENAAVALALTTTFLEETARPLQAAALKQGLATASWPGRMEVVNSEPLMLLDGAHNLPGVQALVKTIEAEFADRQVYLLVGILADKQAELMLGELASLKNAHLYLTPFAGPSASRPSADLSALAAGIQTRYPMAAIADWRLGLYKITQEAGANDVILITGSLYFVSEARNYLEN